MVVVHNRDHPGNLQNSNITYSKNCLGRQGLAQKTSQTFDNTSVQQNIVKNISNVFLTFSDLQKLPISPYSYSYYSLEYLKIENLKKLSRD